MIELCNSNINLLTGSGYIFSGTAFVVLQYIAGKKGIALLCVGEEMGAMLANLVIKYYEFGTVH